MKLTNDRFKKEWFNPLFYYIRHYLRCNDIREIYVYGGSSSGKTHSILQALLLDGYYTDYSTLVYRKEQASVKTTVKNECKAIIENLNLCNIKEYDFEFRYKEKKLQFKGIDKEGKIKGLKGFRKLYFDEIDQFKTEEHSQSKLRLRGEDGQQLIFSWNPVSEKHWIKEYLDSFEWINEPKLFNEPYKNLHESSFVKRCGNKILIKTTYLDNYWVVGGDWGRIDEHVINEFETLKRTNINLYNVYALGNWGILRNDNPFFYSLDIKIHYINEKYILNENQLLYLSFDFNKNPVTLIIATIRDNECAIIDLITANEYTIDGLSPLVACCHIFKEKYIKSGIVNSAFLEVTGDASGRSGGADKKLGKNFYTTIQDELLINKHQVKLRKANIAHLLSQEICNTFIYNCRFRIYKSAERVLDDMLSAQIVNGSLLKDGNNGMHFTDAVRYLIDRILNFDKWRDWLLYYKKKD